MLVPRFGAKQESKWRYGEWGGEALEPKPDLRRRLPQRWMDAPTVSSQRPNRFSQGSPQLLERTNRSGPQRNNGQPPTAVLRQHEREQRNLTVEGLEHRKDHRHSSKGSRDATLTGSGPSAGTVMLTAQCHLRSTDCWADALAVH